MPDLIMLVLIGAISLIIVFFKDELSDIGILLLFFLAILATLLWSTTVALPGTDATPIDLSAMVRECEADLPRNQNCVIDIAVRPEEK